LLSLFEELEESPGGPIGQELTTQGAPHFLPIEAGNHVLIFMKQTLSSRTVDPPSIVVGDLETGRQELLVTGFHPIYSHTGHLVYTADQFGGDLWAVPFSLDTLSVTGEAFPIAQNTRNATVATDQTLVYVDIPESGPEHLVWLDRGGHKTGEIGQPHEAIGWPALSPDGKLLAFTFQARSNEDVWVYDIARETRTRLTSAEGTDMRPVWSPTSEDVGFTSNRAGNRDIYFRRADGSGQAQALLERDEFVYLTDWSKDGRYVLFMRADGISPATPADLWYLERDEGTSDWKPHQFSQSPFHERSAKLSPDGRYVAYVSNESGQNEVYVRPFPEGGRRSTVSSKGGTQAHWSRDGKELFYVEGVTLIAVPVSTGSKFSMGPAKRLFEHSSLAKTPSYPMYDVSADGRFVVVEAAEVTPDRSIHIVQNWYEEFRDREQD